jgi:hypothetical protein
MDPDLAGALFDRPLSAITKRTGANDADPTRLLSESSLLIADATKLGQLTEINVNAGVLTVDDIIWDFGLKRLVSRRQTFIRIY